MNAAFLLIGGNIGDREHYLDAAKVGIAEQCGTITAVSGMYETEAWGLEHQNAFLNQALGLHTTLPARNLLQTLLGIEEQLGRKREVKYGPRTIDIDILLFNNEVIHEPHLTIPHPEIQNRRFALQCLADIAPTKEHPLFHKTVQQLLAECPDPLTVHKIS